MYKIEEIQAIVTGLVPDIKKHDQKIRDGKCKWEDIPEYWPGYKRALKYMNTIKVHSEIGDFPDELFKVRAPNQKPEEFEYIKANYKQNTLPVFMDYISTMQRPFFDGNWSIDYQTGQWSASLVESQNTLQNYVEQMVTPVGSVEDYMKFFVTQIKGVDANGVIAIKPKEIPLTQEGVEIDNTQMFEPVPYYYSTDKKLAFLANKYYLIRTDEKSEVTYGNRKEKKGHVLEFYDDTNIWRIVQSGAFTDYTFDYFLYFEHGWQRVPVAELLGVPQPVENNKVIWISHFHYAIPNLNNALINTQYLNASTAKCMFPYRIVLGRVCSFEYKNKDGVLSTCQLGQVYNTETGINMDCPNCNGTGLQDRISPLGELRLNPDSDFNKGDSSVAAKAMQYVSPETASLEFVRDLIIKDFEDARKILHQQTSNSIVRGTENLTATGLALDTKAMFAFVKTPWDQLFSIWEFILDAMGWMRYGKEYKKAIMISPQSFDYNTDADYLVQISDAQKAGLPPFVIHSIIFRSLQTLSYNEKERAEVFSLIISTDRILTLSQQDILLKFTRGLIQDWEITLHDSAVNLISDLIVADPNFFDLDFKVKQDKLIAQAKSKTATNATPQQLAIQNALAA